MAAPRQGSLITVPKAFPPLCLLVCVRAQGVWVFATPWTVARQAPLSMGFSRQEYWNGVGSHSLLQGIFLTQGLNLLTLQADVSLPSHLASPSCRWVSAKCRWCPLTPLLQQALNWQPLDVLFWLVFLYFHTCCHLSYLLSQAVWPVIT